MSGEAKGENIRDLLKEINQAGNAIRIERIVSELRTVLGDTVMEQLLSALEDNDPDVRAGAAIALGELRDERAVQSLIIAVNNQDMQTAVYASGSLARIGIPAVEALVNAFYATKNKRVRFHLVCALMNIDDPRVIQPLLEALNVKDDLVRKYAAYGIARFRDPRAVDTLIKLLSHKDGDRNEVATAAAETLGEIGDARAAKPIFDAMVAGNIWTPQVLKALGEPAIEILLHTLTDTDPKRCANALYALGELREARATQQLLALLHHGAGEVRAGAAFALGEIGEKNAIEPLVALSNDDFEDARFQAAMALGKICDDDTYQAIRERLDEKGKKTIAWTKTQMRPPR